MPKNGSKEFVEKYLLCASGNGFLGEDGDETTSDPVLNKQSLNNSQTAENDTTESIDDSNEKSSRKSSLLETCQVNKSNSGQLYIMVHTLHLSQK